VPSRMANIRWSRRAMGVLCFSIVESKAPDSFWVRTLGGFCVAGADRINRAGSDLSNVESVRKRKNDRNADLDLLSEIAALCLPDAVCVNDLEVRYWARRCGVSDEILTSFPSQNAKLRKSRK